MCSKNGTFTKVEERENLVHWNGRSKGHDVRIMYLYLTTIYSIYCSHKKSYTPTPHPTHHQLINTQGLIWIIPSDVQKGTLSVVHIHCNGNSVYVYSFSGNSAASVPISTFMCL
jgi:hypothetical protein